MVRRRTVRAPLSVRAGASMTQRVPSPSAFRSLLASLVSGLLPGGRGAERLRFIATEFVQRFMRDGQLKTAAALTYTTLFAVVPLMTVTYTALSVMPEFALVGRDIETFIFSQFVPTAGEEVRAQLHSFSDQAKGLTLWGSGFLLVTSYLLLVNVEEEFNHIWGVTEPRRGVARFLLYWGVLTFGPPALAVATAVSSYLLSLPLLDSLPGVEVRGGFLSLLPWLISGLGFTALYYAVPNCVVRLSHALVGGLVTMLLFHFALRGFTWFFAGSDMQVIYGAFAAVPLFLTWIYFCWALVLGGALLVKLIGEPVRKRPAVVVPPMVGALELLKRLHQAHREGRGVAHDAVLLLLEGVPNAAGVLQRVESADLAVRTGRGEWHLARDLSRVTLWDLSVLLNGDLGWAGQWQGADPAIASRLDAALSSARSHLDVSLEHFLELQAQ